MIEDFNSGIIYNDNSSFASLIVVEGMIYVNATGVKFSPFFDSFQDVVLDGTIINDYEANINLSLVRSYNDDAHISKDVVMVLSRT